jgi:hypothetical protein
MAIPIFNLSDLTGSNGFTINGIAPFDTSGYSVKDAGDINKDGIEDLIIGAPGFTSSDPDPTTTPGNVFVVFGSLIPFPKDFNLSTLNGTNGFVLNGVAPNDFTGFSVSGAGDVDGDGDDDLIIGAYGADINGIEDVGKSYVVFGGTGGFAPSIDLATLDGNNGFTITGSEAGGNLGTSVSGAGDINGDGFADVIVSEPYADVGEIVDAGKSYVVFGTGQGFSSTLNVSDLNGTNGFAIDGIAEDDESGTRVSAAGDFNADGFADLAITAFGADPNGEEKAGEIYVVYGTDQGFSSTLKLSDLDGTNGFVIEGITEGDYSSRVSAAGDVNGDGFGDLAIGAFGADPNDNAYAGTAYVVFGRPEPFSDKFNLSQLDGTNGFAVEGISPFDLSGFSVSSAGDFNGDGFDDVLFGAPGTDSFTGQSVLLFGKEGGFAPSINLDELDGTDGLAFKGVNAYDFSGNSISSVDINGDGLSDLVFGTPYGDPDDKTNAGSTYVVYGRKSINGDEGNNTLNGTISDDTIYAGGGNDQIFGSEGVNTLFGQDGNDSIYGGSQVDYIYAGNGNDTIYASEGNNNIFGDAGDDILYSGSGNDLIDGGVGNDTLWLGGGLDTVVLASGNGFDMINNFQRGQTTLGLSGGLTFNDLNIVQSGNGSLIKVAATGQDLALVEDVTIIIGADFVSV